jgi:hypothetical protein
MAWDWAWMSGGGGGAGRIYMYVRYVYVVCCIMHSDKTRCGGGTEHFNISN